MTRRLVGAAAALAMLAPTTAMAATAPAAGATSVSPIVALSLFASAQSQAALCGAAVSNAAATAATQDTPVQGCVLPAVDAPPVVAQASPAALPAAAGFASPLLIGLGAIALGVGLFALLHKSEGDRRQPASPN